MAHLRFKKQSCWRNLVIGILAVGLAAGQTAWAGPQMHGSHRDYPEPGNVSRQLPKDYQSLRHGQDSYYFHKGVYYHRDPKGYRVVRPPRGLMIDHLLPGFETIVVAGITYFVLAGIFYQKADHGYVVVDAPTRSVESTASQTAIVVDVDLLNVRSGPGMQHPVVGQVYQGTQLEVQGNATGWYYVHLPGGTYGWVMSAYTRPIGTNARG